MPMKGSESLPLTGRTALVTGAAAGIGRATAIELARQGADIAICDIAPVAAGAEIVSTVANIGRHAFYYQGDVGDRKRMMHVFKQMKRDLGRLDILVNNSGLNIRKPLLELKVAEVEKVWSVILWGVFHCTQLAVRQMVAEGHGGNVVMISSVHASRPFFGSSAYDGAKAAINHMASVWAIELAQHKIRVNVIEPGWIDTPGERKTHSQDQIRREGRKLLFGRLGRPEEIAKAVSFLVSDQSSYTTGTCLRVDGGYVLTH
jgi:glucose 1-dehydrogenase